MEMKIFKWCIKNDIRVYPQPTRTGKKPPVKIVLDYKGQIKVGDIEYVQSSKEYHDKVKEVYEWAYNNAKDNLDRRQRIKVDNSP